MNKRDTLVDLSKGERLDELHRNGYKIIQNKNKFCFGIDAVLLSGYSRILQGEKVLDLGTGTGIIPILLEAKTKGKNFVGLEIQEEVVDMAKRSVLYNGLEDKIDIVVGDIKEASSLFGHHSFDVVTSNPPYMTLNHGMMNSDLAKAIARHEIKCDFEDLIRETSKVLKPGGRFYLVHRPFRLVELISILSTYKLEPKRMRMVHPFVDKEPNMVLLECIKGAGAMLKVDPPLVVYQDINKYTDEIHEIYGYAGEA